MSLKIFHGIFIVIAILFTAGFGIYAFSDAGKEVLGDSAKTFGGISSFVALLLVLYGIAFLNKVKKGL